MRILPDDESGFRIAQKIGNTPFYQFWAGDHWDTHGMFYATMEELLEALTTMLAPIRCGHCGRQWFAIMDRPVLDVLPAGCCYCGTMFEHTEVEAGNGEAPQVEG